MRTTLIVAVLACLLVLAHSAAVEDLEVVDHHLEKRSRPENFVDMTAELDAIRALEMQNDEYVLEQAVPGPARRVIKENDPLLRGGPLV